MAQLGASHVEELPVLAETDEGPEEATLKPLGVVTRRDILLFYNHEVLRQGTLGLKYVRKQGAETRSDYVEMPEGHEVNAVGVTPRVAGKTLRELDVRNRFNVNVVAIRSHRYDMVDEADADVPDPARKLRLTDTLIVTGNPEDIEALKKKL